MGDSCLVAAYDAVATLSERDRKFLGSLEKEARAYKRGDVIADRGQDSTTLYVISSGWCASQVADSNGATQIIELHLPGDIAETREIPFQTRMANLFAVTDTTVCPFPKSRLLELFEQSPRLTAIFVGMAARREAVLCEHLFDLGRRDAQARVCHFLIEIQTRLQAGCGRCADDRFELPLNQQQLADILGQTNVHISRVINRLRTLGIADVQRGEVRVLDQQKLRDHAALNGNYLSIDGHWIIELASGDASAG